MASGEVRGLQTLVDDGCSFTKDLAGTMPPEVRLRSLNDKLRSCEDQVAECERQETKADELVLQAVEVASVATQKLQEALKALNETKAEIASQKGKQIGEAIVSAPGVPMDKIVHFIRHHLDSIGIKPPGVEQTPVRIPGLENFLEILPIVLALMSGEQNGILPPSLPVQQPDAQKEKNGIKLEDQKVGEDSDSDGGMSDDHPGDGVSVVEGADTETGRSKKAIREIKKARKTNVNQTASSAATKA